MTKLITLISEVVQEVAHPLIRTSLQQAFDDSEHKLDLIEEAFCTLSSSLPSSVASKACINRFFHNWSMTNNSAVGLSGFCNRLTLRWRKLHSHEPSPRINRQYLNVLSHLNRVTDEDLGAKGGKLHSDLYYEMATIICEDDSWLSRKYLLNEGANFKRWKDRFMVREPDLLMGFLVTLIHEVYTHGEVEFILPLFDQWLQQTTSLDNKERRRCLLWIDVHTKGTEKNHFNETLQALDDLLELLEKKIEEYDLVDIFSEYLSQKALVMATLNNDLKKNCYPITLLAQA
ncbi:MAG: hypothetical protein ACJATK_002221 [Paracoccaceae bacterium]|jgi:hypothetical protein